MQLMLFTYNDIILCVFFLFLLLQYGLWSVSYFIYYNSSYITRWTNWEHSVEHESSFPCYTLCRVYMLYVLRFFLSLFTFPYTWALNMHKNLLVAFPTCIHFRFNSISFKVKNSSLIKSRKSFQFRVGANFFRFFGNLITVTFNFPTKYKVSN